jgi:hypothetical protein
MNLNDDLSSKQEITRIKPKVRIVLRPGLQIENEIFGASYYIR